MPSKTEPGRTGLWLACWHLCFFASSRLCAFALISFDGECAFPAVSPSRVASCVDTNGLALEAARYGRRWLHGVAARREAFVR